MNRSILGGKAKIAKAEALSKEVRKHMVSYWDSEDVDRIQLGITGIKIKDTKANIEINITLEKVGAFIGRGGVRMKSFQDYMNARFDKRVRVLLVEDKTWLNLH